MTGPPIGGGPAAGTTTCDAITVLVTPMLLSGGSSIPTGGEELGVPTAGVPPVVTVAAAAVVDAVRVLSPVLLSSGRM
jgi:hypothetical protein